MIIKSCDIHHVVLGPDLNHHGTLFAGQAAKWFVEAGFIAAANLTSPKHIVCINVHGMKFKKPAPSGTIIRYESRIILAGTSRLVAYIKANKSQNNETLFDGFVTFVHVDDHGKAAPHGITVEAVTPEDVELQKIAKEIS